MQCIRLLCSGLIVLLVLFAGCSKQDKQKTMKKTAEMPTLEKKAGGDTSDIFKEFYSDDTAGQGSASKSAKTKSVKNETFSPASTQTASSSEEFSPNAKYVVQVSCVVSKSLANKMVSTLKSMSYPAYTATVQNPTPNLSGTYYRVRIGGFNGFAAAKAFGEKSLVPNGYQYWVDRKSNDNVGMEGYGLGGSVPSGSYESASPSSSSTSNPTGSETYMPAATPEANYSAPEPAAASEVKPEPVTSTPAATPEPSGSSAAPAAVAPSKAASSTTSSPATITPAETTPSPAAASPAAKGSPKSGTDATKASGSSDWEADSGSGNW